MLALTALAHDRSLPQAVVLEAMQLALEHAYKKDSNGQDVRVDIDLESGDQVVRTIRTVAEDIEDEVTQICLLYTSPSPRDLSTSRMPSSA